MPSTLFFLQQPTETLAKRIGWTINAVLCIVVALISYRYLLGIGPGIPLIDANSLRNPWLSIHVLGAATALLLSPFQFVRRIRMKYPAAHRLIGRGYAFGCIVGGVSGLLLAVGISSGPISMAGFGLLALAWLYTTIVAWQAAVKRDFVAHRAWMIRSFALTYAAVTLRLYLPILLAMPSIPFIDGYRAIAFLCWVPNLLLAELFLFLRPRPA